MDIFSGLSEYAWLSHAIWASLLSGVVCGIVGCYIVCRRSVFLASGITHASFGGLGMACWAGANPILGATVFAILSAIGIEWASERGHIREDSAIGIVWSIGMATGGLFMSLRPGYTSGDLAGFLFGSIITTTRGDVGALALLTVAVVAGAAMWMRPLMWVAFDSEYARSQGISTRTVGYVMAAVTALSIVLSIRVMGIVLLLSLLTMPVVIANTFSHSWSRIVLAAPAIAVAANLAGLALSYRSEIPSGTAIIFILTAALLAAKLVARPKRLALHENHL